LQDGVTRKGGPYELRIILSRPAGAGGYGSGMDSALERIRADGQVADVQIDDVQRAPRWPK
jgi:hypothetical protein